MQDLFTTSRCNPGSVITVISNFFNIHGAIVQAARHVLFICHPMYASSLVIKTIYHAEDSTINKSSRLNADDTLCRLPEFSEGITTSSSFGVNIFNHNSSHMTLGHKKAAHITLYTLGKGITLASDCTSADRTDTANNFVDLPYDSVLCSLVEIEITDPNDLHLVQASSPAYVENYVLGTSDVLIVDFTLFQAYNVEGNLKDSKEHMVDFPTNSLNYDTPSDIESATDFTNDKIGTLLKTLGPSRIDQGTVDLLVGMASMRVRWENGDYFDILLNKTQVIDGVETPVWCIIAVSAMALIFLLPQISRLVIRRIPEYVDNLRNLLLLTIERSSNLEGLNNKAKDVDILLSTDDKEAGRNALLSVNGHPITVTEKSTSLERRSTDERTTGINELYKHPDGSVPFLE